MRVRYGVSTAILTNFPQEKMAIISRMIFSDAISWMKSFVFWLKVHWSLCLRLQLTITQHAGLGSNTFYQIQIQIHFFPEFQISNTNTNTLAKIWSNTNINANTAHQIQIRIHNEGETKLLPFYRWHCIVRRLFYLFKFHWKLFPKVQSTISLHWFR